MTEPHMTSQHSRPGKVHFPRFENDSFVQRPMFELIVLSEENAQENGVARNLHVTPISSR